MWKEKKKQASVFSLLNSSIFLVLFAPVVLCELGYALQYIFDYSLVPYGYDACISVLAVVVLIQVFVVLRYVIRWRQQVLFFKRRWDERTRINRMNEISQSNTEDSATQNISTDNRVTDDPYPTYEDEQQRGLSQS